MPLCGRLSHNPLPPPHANEHSGDDAEDDDSDVHKNDGENDGQDVVMLMPFRLTAVLLLLF